MKRSPVRMLVGFSSSGPSRQLSPISRASRAQDTDGFFVVEAAAGASETFSAGASLGSEAAAAGAAPDLETGANGGGIEARGTSFRTVVVPGAIAICGASPPGRLVASELLGERGGDACFAGFVFFFGGAFASLFFFFFSFDGVASWR